MEPSIPCRQHQSCRISYQYTTVVQPCSAVLQLERPMVPFLPVHAGQWPAAENELHLHASTADFRKLIHTVQILYRYITGDMRLLGAVWYGMGHVRAGHALASLPVLVHSLQAVHTSLSPDSVTTEVPFTSGPDQCKLIHPIL